MRQLYHSAGSQLAGVDHRIAEGIEYRLDFAVGFRAARRQHLNAAIGDPLSANDQWRIHHLRPAQSKFSGNAPDEISTTARKIDINTAVAHAVDKSVCPQRNRFNLARPRQRRKNRPGNPAQLPPPMAANRAPDSTKRRAAVRHDVINHHRIASLLNIPGHDSANGSQTNKTYSFHFEALTD